MDNNGYQNCMHSSFIKFTIRILLLWPMLSFSQINTGAFVVRPIETDDLLNNPGIGFTTFQMFNGDNLAFHDVLDTAEIKLFGRNNTLENKNHPITSIAYFRIQWRFIEPEPGKYRWDFIDALLNIARLRRQTLMLRISPSKTGIGQDVPDWYRKIVGPNRTFASKKWVVDPEDPRYAKYFGGMIKALGERYDGHPDLESVDVSIVGSAGEGGGTELLTDQTMQNLLDPYIEAFKKTPLHTLIHGQKHIQYLKDHVKSPLGWRQDCLGDLGFWADEQNGWTHMFDYYPQTIINYNMQDAWKKGPVSFEICGFFDTWDSGEKYSEKQVQYIIDESLKWHISSFNAKSSAVPKKWEPLVNDWLKKMGYRFVLRKFSCPQTIKRNSKLPFETWWENKGVAPCYKHFPLAIKLNNDKDSVTFITDADIRNWLPGDNLYDNSVFIPKNFTPGNYDAQIAIVDPLTGKPKIQLAIEGKDAEGWYSLGKIKIE